METDLVTYRDVSYLFIIINSLLHYKNFTETHSRKYWEQLDK